MPLDKKAMKSQLPTRKIYCLRFDSFSTLDEVYHLFHSLSSFHFLRSQIMSDKIGQISSSLTFLRLMRLKCNSAFSFFLILSYFVNIFSLCPFHFTRSEKNLCCQGVFSNEKKLKCKKIARYTLKEQKIHS